MGGTAAGRREHRAGPPQRGPPRQHNINKKSCKSGRNGDIIPRSLYTDTASPAGKWGARWDRHGYAVGKWASPGLVKGKQGLHPSPTSTRIPTPPLVIKALQGALGGQEFPLDVPRERGSPIQPCLSAGMGATYLPLVGHAGNNELKECCPPLTLPSAQSEGALPGSQGMGA